MLNSFDPALPSFLIAATVKVKVPRLEGVPEIDPFFWFKFNPSGSAPAAGSMWSEAETSWRRERSKAGTGSKDILPTDLGSTRWASPAPVAVDLPAGFQTWGILGSMPALCPFPPSLILRVKKLAILAIKNIGEIGFRLNLLQKVFPANLKTGFIH